MVNDRGPVGYKRPPNYSRFKKGESGNPRGRRKRSPYFLEDATAILNAPVTGQANGKSVTLPTIQAMFRRLCRNALKGDNAALRQAIDLILKLEPEYREKAQVDVKDANINRRKLAERLGLDPEYFLSGPSKPDPTTARLRKQAEAMAKEERKRLIREAQSRGDLPE